jgi:hypothetical protein
VRLLILIHRGSDFRWGSRLLRAAGRTAALPVEWKTALAPLPRQVPRRAKNYQQEHYKSYVAARLFIFVKVVEFDLRIFGESQKRRPMNRDLFAITVCRAGNFLRDRLRFGSRRVRQRSPAHAAETVFRAVIVSAVSTADVHGFKHIVFPWMAEVLLLLRAA